MDNVDSRTISVCIQALQDAIVYLEGLSQSETVDPSSLEESLLMYERELNVLAEVYRKRSVDGNTNIPIESLLKTRFHRAGL